MIPVFSSGKWIIVFIDTGTKTRTWWSFFTRPGFRHCCALRYLKPMDSWVLVDWSNENLSVEFLPKRFVDALIVGVNNLGGCFVETEAKKASFRKIPFTPLYCVSAMKDLIGLRNCKVVTPYQLYCALIKAGGKRIFDLGHPKEI